LQRGDYDKVASAAEQLLQRCPTFAPALNNRSEAWFRLGRIDLAIADVRRVLEFDANNFHALSNLARYLFLAGRSEEAVETARRLTDCKSTSPDLYVKQAEALVFLADWPCVLNALHQAESRDDLAHGADGGLLYHLAGVAAAELGQLDVARKHWKRAVKLGLVSSWAKHNLDDLRLPIGEQNGPWAYPIDYWIPRPVFDRLIAGMEQAGPKAKDADVRRRVRRFLGQHPYIERILPHLLELGDPIAKEFVVRLASLAETPSFFAALRDFAFGRRGPDRLRHQAAMVLVEAGQLASGRQRLWCEGELRELALMRYEITPEPLHALPKEIERLAQKARDAIRSQDGELAESLLVEAMQQRPDDPSLQYNRAVAILLQGREKEAMSLVRDIHARYPDYLFARVRLAEDAVKRRDFDAARSLLDPLMERNRFHQSEFAAMCNANIELLAARGDKDGARIWFDMWQRTDSNDPRAKQWNSRLDKRGFLGRFFAE
ncbi:MAG: tetratricopeptide repeat protein, partial [Planctomycetes bacterium]|nr:tetratricopeptide repeat protein [Planctomycetota bacterium]